MELEKLNKSIAYQDEKTRQTDKFLFDIHFMIF